MYMVTMEDPIPGSLMFMLKNQPEDTLSCLVDVIYILKKISTRRLAIEMFRVIVT